MKMDFITFSMSTQTKDSHQICIQTRDFQQLQRYLNKQWRNKTYSLIRFTQSLRKPQPRTEERIKIFKINFESSCMLLGFHSVTHDLTR